MRSKESFLRPGGSLWWLKWWWWGRQLHLIWNKQTWHEFLTMIVQAVLSVFIDTTFLFGMPLLEGRGPLAGLENIKDKYVHISFMNRLFLCCSTLQKVQIIQTHVYVLKNWSKLSYPLNLMICWLPHAQVPKGVCVRQPLLATSPDDQLHSCACQVQVAGSLTQLLL